MIKASDKILIVAAHQDDETIGCGGSIKKWTLQGVDVEVAFVTNGDTGIDQRGLFTETMIVATRNKEADDATGILGINKIHHLNIECQKVKNSQKIFHKFIRLIRQVKPDLIITHAPHDKHRDHRNTSEILREATWKAGEDIHPEFGKAHRVRDLWAFEITDLLPTVDFVVDITDTFSFKTEAMSVYDSQHNIICGINEHIDGISKVRGYAIGKPRGEAFMRLSSTPTEI